LSAPYLGQNSRVKIFASVVLFFHMCVNVIFVEKIKLPLVILSWIQGFSATGEVIKSFVCKNKNTKD
jgi:hypothetical protein